MKLVSANLLVSATAFCQERSNLEVEALVFSGTLNPTFSLTKDQQKAFCEAVASASPLAPTCRVLGFTGWRVCNERKCQIFRGDAAIDEILLSAVRSELTRPVLTHIEEETTRLLSSNDACEDEVEMNSTSSCGTAIVGPDDPALVLYDVAHDDGGCFQVRQSDNNCYNYGTDVLTNTFAQPGRGSGYCAPGSRPCAKNTCEDVKAAAISDGLTWVGTDLPIELPETGHYVSLHIWENSNFHWLRMDSNMKFSHKPGGSAVRNVDNNQKLITDPSTADVSPWSLFCGYMHVVPSKIGLVLNSVLPPPVNV